MDKHYARWSDEDDALLVKMANARVPYNDIAKAVGRSYNTVKQRACKLCVSYKDHSKDAFFDKPLTAAGAYILGFIVADGHVAKDLRKLIISQSNNDGLEHLHKMREILGGSIYSNGNAHQLFIMRKPMCCALKEKYGLTNNKCDELKWIDIPDEVFDHYARGVFDGDGSIDVKRCSVDMCCKSADFAYAWRDKMTSLLGVTGSLIKSKSKIYSWRLFTIDTLKFLSWLYDRKESSLWLERKNRQFEAIKILRGDGLKDRKKMSVWRFSAQRDSSYIRPPSGYSDFNPTLAENCIRYWSKPGDFVLDPFAGWGMRAEACLRLDRKYLGFDVSRDAVTWAVEQLLKKYKDFTNTCNIVPGDGLALDGVASDSIDLILTCPPYWNMEKYDAANNNQLSAADSFEAFCEKLNKCVQRCHDVLKKDRYIVFVVGDFRRKGKFYPFHLNIINMMTSAGFVLWDDVVYIAHGDKVLPGMARASDNDYTVRIHQNVVVAKKPAS